MKATRFLTAITMVLITGFAYSQSLVTEKADASFKNGKFNEAIDLYKYAFGKAKDKLTKNYINYQVAVCYYKINDYRQAETWFRKTTRKDPHSNLAYLYFAQVLHANNKLDEAEENYKKYLETNLNDPIGKTGLQSVKNAKEWTANPTRYKVLPMYYFNSKYSDYGIAYARDNYKSVVFTSSRETATGGKMNPVTGQYYSDIFISTIDKKGQWSKPEPVSGEVNTEFEEGAPSTNAKASIMYFTSVRENDKGQLTTQIYVSRRDGLGWGKPERVVLFESDTIAVGHPALSPDEKTLYFVSSVTGGIGGKDIWYSTLEGGKWSKPKNMGPEINTPGDEVFPFVHADGTFYFSSNGHPGMGGLDIFRAKYTDGKWEVKNMQYPVNSVRDDFGIIIESTFERGFFCSNREESRGSDDIFQFNLPPLEIKLILTVKSERTNEGISDASVNIIGSDGTNETKASEQNGTLTIMLNPNTDYSFISRKGGFLAGRGKLSTYGLSDSKTLNLDIYMTPNDAPRLVNVMYDFGKWELRPESITALEELVQILRDDNPNITIELSAHTDARGSATFNKELSQKRAQSVVDFLILYGIDVERLTAVGYGKDRPKVISPKEAAEFAQKPGYEFLKAGVVLTETYINSLPTEEMKEIAHGLNRRTEFRVTGTDYVPRVRRRK
ncbi:MAG TPA: OmpA family protein [Salinivirgaceae bacterium]|nr:OmpA family protein [Salinivirgaceae bacterium]